MRTGSLNKLTAGRVKAPGEGMHSDGGGLFLRVAGPRRSWVFRFTSAGRKREMGLGPAASVSLASARAKAAEARALVAAGDDPIVVRQRASAPENLSSASPGLMTFRKAVDAFLPGHLRTLSNAKHRAQWRSTLEVYAADLMPLRCAEITAARVSDCLSPIWLEKPETASRTRQRVELVLAYADAREDRDRSNPAALRGPLRFLLPAQKKRVRHHPAVRVSEAPAAFAEVAARQDRGAGYRALLTLILTALRSGELRHLQWSDIDEAASVIRIPATRMKARRDHVIPLTSQLARHLAAQPRFGDSPFVFPSANGGPISNMTIAMAMRRTGLDAVPHGWRSTFRDWATESGWPRELAEHQLAHLVGSMTERSYARGTLLEARRPMLEAWEAFLGAGGTAVGAGAAAT